MSKPNGAILTLKKMAPRSIKHPLLVSMEWYWKLRRFPVQSLGDMAVFKQILSNAGEQPTRVFEWGSGASTIYYPKFLKSVGHRFEWHAMENSADWHKKTREGIVKSQLQEQVHLHLSEFLGFWLLPGYSIGNPVPPQEDSHSSSVIDYINKPARSDEPFDVVIIDGRFRRRCLLVAREVLAPKGVVILHDAQKVHYHSALSEFPNVRFIETGQMPGISRKSTIALCSADDSPWLTQLMEEHDAFLWSDEA